jgi:curved DNA-binding protein CbpA
MFKDYYAILDISETASLEQIRDAFKKQAIKWHPDKNQGFDTTEIMQDINEAYLILKDVEGRLKYDKEYNLFKSYKETLNSLKNTKKQAYENNHYDGYNIKDFELRKWMHNARNQAVDLAKQTIKDFSGMVKEGCLSSFDLFIKVLVAIIVTTLLWLILFNSSRGCS